MSYFERNNVLKPEQCPLCSCLFPEPDVSVVGGIVTNARDSSVRRKPIANRRGLQKENNESLNVCVSGL